MRKINTSLSVHRHARHARTENQPPGISPEDDTRASGRPRLPHAVTRSPTGAGGTGLQTAAKVPGAHRRGLELGDAVQLPAGPASSSHPQRGPREAAPGRSAPPGGFPAKPETNRPGDAGGPQHTSIAACAAQQDGLPRPTGARTLPRHGPQHIPHQPSQKGSQLFHRVLHQDGTAQEENKTPACAA